MFEVGFAASATAAYERAEVSLARKLDRCFTQLEKTPLKHPNIKRLTGEFSGASRYRVGDYRVIFRVDVDAKFVFILAIAHRREVYE